MVRVRFSLLCAMVTSWIGHIYSSWVYQAIYWGAHLVHVYMYVVSLYIYICVYVYTHTCMCIHILYIHKCKYVYVHMDLPGKEKKTMACYQEWDNAWNICYNNDLNNGWWSPITIFFPVWHDAPSFRMTLNHCCASVSPWAEASQNRPWISIDVAVERGSCQHKTRPEKGSRNAGPGGTSPDMKFEVVSNCPFYGESTCSPQRTTHMGKLLQKKTWIPSRNLT